MTRDEDVACSVRTGEHSESFRETLRVLAVVVADEELRALHVPTLLLMGEHEVICDAAGHWLARVA